MADIQARNYINSQVWKIADRVRGAIDGWDFKSYILGALFYRYQSEDFAKYVEEGCKEIEDYSLLKDEEVTEDIKKTLLQDKGYFILPSQLFVNVMKTAKTNVDLNKDLQTIFREIENTTNENAKDDLYGLYADFDVTSRKLGDTHEEKQKRLYAILNGIAEIDFNFDSENNENDIFGDVYEFLIHNYASNAGKSGGEFFTPQSVAKLLCKIATQGKKEICDVYDPACGSGSLLLQVRKQFKDDNSINYYGQDINATTYNLSRMNMFLHGLNYSNFNIKVGDTLLSPKHLNKKFDVIVSNPPYSVEWQRDQLVDEEGRFDILAPQKNADLAFVQHALYYLSPKGKAAIVCFPGVFYRSGVEEQIRKSLVKKNVVDAIITLPKKLFYGTSIATVIMVLNNDKQDDSVLFVNASDLFKKETNNNILTEENIEQILTLLEERKTIEGLTCLISNQEVIENGSLAPIDYIKKTQENEEIDIEELNQEVENGFKEILNTYEEIKNLIKEF